MASPGYFDLIYFGQKTKKNWIAGVGQLKKRKKLYFIICLNYSITASKKSRMIRDITRNKHKGLGFELVLTHPLPFDPPPRPSS